MKSQEPIIKIEKESYADLEKIKGQLKNFLSEHAREIDVPLETWTPLDLEEFLKNFNFPPSKDLSKFELSQQIRFMTAELGFDAKKEFNLDHMLRPFPPLQKLQEYLPGPIRGVEISILNNASVNSLKDWYKRSIEEKQAIFQALQVPKKDSGQNLDQAFTRYCYELFADLVCQVDPVKVTAKSYGELSSVMEKTSWIENRSQYQIVYTQGIVSPSMIEDFEFKRSLVFKDFIIPALQSEQIKNKDINEKIDFFEKIKDSYFGFSQLMDISKIPDQTSFLKNCSRFGITAKEAQTELVKVFYEADQFDENNTSEVETEYHEIQVDLFGPSFEDETNDLLREQARLYADQYEENKTFLDLMTETNQRTTLDPIDPETFAEPHKRKFEKHTQDRYTLATLLTEKITQVLHVSPIFATYLVQEFYNTEDAKDQNTLNEFYLKELERRGLWFPDEEDGDE